MGSTSLWVVLLLALTVMASSIVIVSYFERHRVSAMHEAGRQAGLIPFAKEEHFTYVPVELMRKKRRGVGFALKGDWKGVPIVVFDLFHPSNRSVVFQTVLLVQLEGRHFPEFAAIERNINYYVPTVDLLSARNAPMD